ncbi:HAD-IA family hydrolase [Roseovarius sp. CAU 1744]|uniref:HAD family hydrolase n=1 Tax=Roseovarius sp. CAU 1744 TaxID=3140368 RepID=UPI00325BFE96
MKLPGAAIRAVIFDCDGVLVDSERITIRLLRDDLARYGFDLPLDQIMAIFVGGTIKGGAVEVIRRGAALPEDWTELFYAKMFAALAAEVEAVPGVTDLLARLHQAGIARAVGSNGPPAKMEITLTRTGLRDWLSPHIYSAQELENPKPAPDIYLHAARCLDASPENCVVVEDSVSGARAARAAGMRCIGYADAGQGAFLAPHCDAVVHDMQAVARLLGV